MSGFGRYSYKDVIWHSKSINSLKWNVDGSLLGALAGDKVVRIGQLDSTGSVATVQSIPCTVQMIQVCWHPQEPNRFALCSDEKPVEFWDLRASKPALKLSSLGGNINMSWSPSGNYMAIGNKSDNLAVFDVRTATMVKKKKIHLELNELAWTANSDHIVAAVTSEHAGGAALISFANDELREIETVVGHSASCYFLEVDAQRQRMAIGSQDFCVTLWETSEFVPKHTLPIDAEIRSLSFSGDGRQLAIGTEDNSVLICDTSSGEPLAKVPSRSKAATLDWHPRRSLLALSCEDKTCNLRLLSFPDHSP